MNLNGSVDSNLGMSEDSWMTQPQGHQQKQDSKIRPHAQAHLLSPTDKCKVCNEPAAKHVHYGAMTCFSCRAFFRRSIQNKTAATYVCRRSKNCEINLRTRKNCQFCRYMRCIAVGMKPTWVLSEEERQRRFRKNREKQDQQGQPGPKKEKNCRSRGNSFSDFKPDFTLDSIEESLTDTLMSSTLLMDQPLPQMPERSRENIPVILEKQKVVIKNESQNPPADNGPVHIENIPLNHQFFNEHILKAGPSFQQHILVKTESSSFQPKAKLEPIYHQEQKVFHQQANQKVMIAPTVSTQPTIVLYTTSSHYHPTGSSISTLSQGDHKSTIIVQPSTSAIKTPSTYPVTIKNSGCLSSSKPHTATTSLQNADVSKMRQNYLPTNLISTPSVIVQPTPRFQPQEQYQMADHLKEPLYTTNHHQKLALQAHPMQDYVPESTFPLEIGSFATISSEDQISPMPSPYSSTPSPQNVNSSMASSDSSNQNKQIHYIQPYSQNIQQRTYDQYDYDWDSNYEDDIFTSDEEENNKAMMEAIRNEPEIKFSSSEYNQLERLVKEHDERYRSVNFGEELIKEMIMCSMFGIPVSTSAAINGYRLSVERITRIAHNLECFTDLPKIDQNNLLKENADLLVNLRGAIFFDSKKKGVDQVLISMGIDDLETIKTMFTPLLKENSMKHIDYKTFNSIQAVANPAVESRYNFLQTKVADLVKCRGRMITDDITTILITYIILFSVDFCTLMDRRMVEQTQERYIRMLQRYIYSKTPRRVACTVLANTLNAVTCLREMADIKKSRAINLNVKVS